MASELRVNTLKDASGNNSVATSTVASGSAKHWLNMFGDDASTRDSFNTSSTNDDATGKKTVNLTTSHDSADFAPVTSVGETISSAGNRASTASPTDSNTYLFYTSSSNSGSYNDNDYMTAATHGDLA